MKTLGTARRTRMTWLPLLFAGTLLRAGGFVGVADPDGKTVWYDGKDLTLEGKGWMQTESYYDRLPAHAKEIVPSNVWNLGRDAAGLCLRFTTDAASIQVRWALWRDRLGMAHMPATGVSGVDLYQKDKAGRWQFAGNGRPTRQTNTAAFAVTAGGDCLLYLPLYNGVRSVEIGVPKGQTLARPAPSARDRAKPIVVYGTSITQGGCASRPGMAAAAIIGRQLDVPVINLGFDASGKMEPEMAALLAELDPSVYVLDCLWNMPDPLVAERVAPFVKTLRRAHPDTPILLVEDSSYQNITPTSKGKILRTVYERLKTEGIQHLVFVANTGMLGEDKDGTVDGCHPTDLGMMRQASVLAAVLSPLVVGVKE